MPNLLRHADRPTCPAAILIAVKPRFNCVANSQRLKNPMIPPPPPGWSDSPSVGGYPSPRLCVALSQKRKKNNPPTSSEAPDFSAMTPLQILDWLAENPQVPAGWGDDYRRELAEMREQDAQIEEQRERDRGKVAEPTPPYSV
jgi:hypothetical protein